MVFLLVAGRVLSSSWSAVVQKKLALAALAPSLIFGAAMVALAAIVSPGMIFVSFSGLPPAFWANIFAATLLDVPGNILLARSFSLTDLSLAGPLSCYKPVVALALGFLFLGETPSVLGLTGALVIVAGSLLLAPSGERGGTRAFAALASHRGVRARALSLVMTAAAAVFEKAAILESSVAHSFLAWTFLSAAIAAALWRIMRPAAARADLELVRANWGRVILLAALFLPLAWLSVKILQALYVGYALALFQLSALLNVLFGYSVFREENVVPRAIGACVMILGAAILILGG